MEEEKFIIEYNKLINRIKKAEEFLQSKIYKGKDGKEHKFNSLDQEIKYKEKWVPEYQKLIRQTWEMAQKYKELTGYEMNIEEYMNGFSI